MTPYDIPTPTLVPNEFPSIHTEPYRLAIVGEAPGVEEVAQRRPFVGVSGQFLSALLHSAGIIRAACFVGNIVQLRPPNNDIKHFDQKGEEFTHGITVLSSDLWKFQPHCVLLLGATALGSFFSGGYSISDYRGTVFRADRHPFAGLKCVASFHPAAVLRQYSWAPILGFDLKRAKEEAHYEEVKTPERQFDLDLTADEVIGRLESISAGQLVSFDIEGGISGVPCCSISTDSSSAFIVAFKGGREHRWSDEDETRVWHALARVLEDTRVPKVLQNSLYDRFVLAYNHGLLIRNVAEDTMLKHWELYSELEKNLGFQASLYTREPFYKSERKTDSERVFHSYCCKDSAVTLEISQRLDGLLPDERAREHYRFNMGMLNPLLYMELRGVRFDARKCASRVEEVVTKVEDLQASVETRVGHLLNVESPKQMKAYLYEERGFKPVIDRRTGLATTRYEAILGLAKKSNDPIIFDIIKLRSLRTRQSMLQIRTDKDNRIRCGYNIVGTSTGRLSCYTSPTGSGFNLQTVPKDDRDLFLADDDYHLFQCDLSGADGWTVAAHCARLGDERMLEDLKAGIKIAKVIALMFLKGPNVSTLPRDELKAMCALVSSDDPIYFGSKCCQHGTNYGMGKVLLSQTIFIQSEGEVNIPASDADRLQRFYHLRYPGVSRWQRWVQEQLNTTKRMTSASGHTRRFFGRPTDHDTLKEALSNEPQENTTYATNLAAWRLWHDPDNRRESGALIVEPLHQVHDALVGQFRKDDTEFAITRIKQWFNNQLEIANQRLVIPFEGYYGRSWGELTEKI